jgi:DNA invertase Pin-like site-specific DNA recombinase
VTKKELGKSRAKNQKIAFGDGNPNSKLTDSMVKEIKKLLKSGVQSKVIQRKFGISDAAVSLIKRNKIWKNTQI